MNKVERDIKNIYRPRYDNIDEDWNWYIEGTGSPEDKDDLPEHIYNIMARMEPEVRYWYREFTSEEKAYTALFKAIEKL